MIDLEGFLEEINIEIEKIYAQKIENLIKATKDGKISWEKLNYFDGYNIGKEYGDFNLCVVQYFRVSKVKLDSGVMYKFNHYSEYNVEDAWNVHFQEVELDSTEYPIVKQLYKTIEEVINV